MDYSTDEGEGSSSSSMASAPFDSDSSSDSDEDEHILIDLIRRRRWDDAMATMKTEEGREELRRENDYGRLPLHWACYFGAPFELVEAMVEEYPEAVKLTDGANRLPLHCACTGDPGLSLQRVVRLLLDAYPEGSKATDDYNNLPLHRAASWNAPLEVLRMFIDAHPKGAATRNNCGKVPIHLCADGSSPEKVDDTERVVALLHPILNDEEACQVSVPGNGGGTGTPLHIGARFDLLSVLACTKLPRCPPEVFMTVARLHLGQLGKRDEGDNLPLHVAAANPIVNGARVLSSASDDGDEGDRARVGAPDDAPDNDGRSGGGKDDASEGVEKDFIGELVKLYPEAAAATDGEGRFPLVLAIESGKKWNEGVEAIVGAGLWVVAMRDEATGLYPFMLAASTGDDPCLSTVYGLLRRCPELGRFVLG